jgi:DNA-binding transcriptional LysR family regulator
VELALEKAGFKLKAFRKVIELDSTEAIKSAVEVGLGVGFVSRWAIAKELVLRNVESRRSQKCPSHTTLYSHFSHWTAIARPRWSAPRIQGLTLWIIVGSGTLAFILLNWIHV